jgi:2,4-dienoyl-CoA reductase-like NADH-dependent reductase (Old Yellow Enzyme family)
MNRFPSLFSPAKIGAIELKNRVIFGPHGTTLGHDGKVTDDLIAYHEARARGGAGLIILESATVHETYAFPQQFIYLGSDECIPGISKLVATCHQHDCKVFGQLFHAGRAVRISLDGSQSIAWAPSIIPDERYRIVPRVMSTAMVYEIIEAYVEAALRLQKAGCDGVEILAGMGYLVSQFMNPLTNQREDEFGGSLENRLRFLTEILTRTRAKVNADFVIGIRISGDELDGLGLDADAMLKICKAIDEEQLVDYFNVIASSSATPYGWIRVFPPMEVEPLYAAPFAKKIKQNVSKPVILGGRINQPQDAEKMIAEGVADFCAMVRPFIADPEFALKAENGRSDDIRACVACNQACVGHRLAHFPVSCIQYPESGRERVYGKLMPVNKIKKIMVVGGGPAGMKAAIVAASRGHIVEIFEKSAQLGGNVLMAQQLPGREEFGGVATNLTRELQGTTAKIHLNQEVTVQTVTEFAADIVIMASGSVPRKANLELDDKTDIIYAHDIIENDVKTANSVVIADWRCDWTGLGVAEKLAKEGCYVRLAVNGFVAGEHIQSIVRDAWIAKLHRLGVEITPFARLFGSVERSVFFQHITSHEPIVFEDVGTLVIAHGYNSNSSLADSIVNCDSQVIRIGDCLQPRSVEEAVFDGLKVATEI